MHGCFQQCQMYSGVALQPFILHIAIWLSHACSMPCFQRQWQITLTTYRLPHLYIGFHTAAVLQQKHVCSDVGCRCRQGRQPAATQRFSGHVLAGRPSSLATRYTSSTCLPESASLSGACLQAESTHSSLQSCRLHVCTNSYGQSHTAWHLYSVTNTLVL